eukprot:7916848-Alexandrium_andersonii.AAC.1
MTLGGYSGDAVAAQIPFVVSDVQWPIASTYQLAEERGYVVHHERGNNYLEKGGRRVPMDVIKRTYVIKGTVNEPDSDD